MYHTINMVYYVNSTNSSVKKKTHITRVFEHKCSTSNERDVKHSLSCIYSARLFTFILASAILSKNTSSKTIYFQRTAHAHYLSVFRSSLKCHSYLHILHTLITHYILIVCVYYYRFAYRNCNGKKINLSKWN